VPSSGGSGNPASDADDGLEPILSLQQTGPA
jgi:hypothetical protein